MQRNADKGIIQRTNKRIKWMNKWRINNDKEIQIKE